VGETEFWLLSSTMSM